MTTDSRLAHARPAGLWRRLKAATEDPHHDAEHSDFMERLFTGAGSREDFVRLQEQALIFYRALEDAGHLLADHPVASRVIDPRLERVARLESDLDELHGDHTWREALEPTPETRDYVARLRRIGEERDGVAFVAHHYVRYLGDLSGGQAIAAVCRRRYGIPPEALSFYRFEEVGPIKRYRDAYRAELDRLPLAPGEDTRLIAEAGLAFRLNMAVFAGLGRGEPAAAEIA